MTSSKIRTIPSSSQILRKLHKKSLSASTSPMFAAIGSNIIAATSPLFASTQAFTEVISLYVHTKVFLVISFGMPGLVGIPNVKAPEPDFTSNASLCP